MRSIFMLSLVLCAACIEAPTIPDLSGIDDWSCCGTGGGDPGGYPYTGTIRAVVTTDRVFGPGSEFQLEAWDRQWNRIRDSAGSYTSTDTLVITVSAEGWAVARSVGTVTILYGRSGTLLASETFRVGVPAPDSDIRLEVHGTAMECTPPFNCTPAGSPILQGWIGQTIDVAGIRLAFVGGDGLQPTDIVTAEPAPFAPCPSEGSCASVAGPSPDHRWVPGDTVLCLAVTVGDSVSTVGWVTPENADWDVVWSRPGLFLIRQPVHLYVRPLLTEPPSAC